jgi:putative transposase
MWVWLTEDLKEEINIKRVRRLMREMGLEAVYPKPNLSRANAQHKKYPYLLKGLDITRPNQVWGTDITYIRLTDGFVYLVAIIDWYSRYVLAWELSVTLDVQFCLDALERALDIATPEIFNSDQGVQFTCQEFTGRLEAAKVQISMDGRGRAMDNVFTERLWRSVKYEDVYLKDYGTVPVARENLGGYFGFYNGKRRHQSLGYRTPEDVYFEAA